MADTAIAIGDRLRKIGAAVATGGSSSVQDFGFCRSTFTVYVDYTGTITTASIQLQASFDGGTTFMNVGSPSTTTTDFAFSVTGIAAQVVRVAVTITGGGTADLYLGAV